MRRRCDELWALCVATACLSCVPEGPKTERRPPADAPSLAPEAAAVIDAVFRDDFERAELGPDWHALSSSWRIESGRLCVQGAKNQGVWLLRRLPIDARIEFDAVARSPEGDIKVELWGDGKAGASGPSYSDATSYLAIFGGWKNTQHVFARLDEHGDDRLAIAVDPASEDPRARPVAVGRPYRFRFERRQGNMITWAVDDVTWFELVDEEPLRGPGHEHFAFNDWASHVCFDNLVIAPL